MRTDRRRRLGSLAACAALTIAAGCGSGERASKADRADVSRALGERLDADPAEIDCVLDYLVEDYDDEQLTLLAEDGLEALPQGLWEAYFTSTIACLTTDQ